MDFIFNEPYKRAYSFRYRKFCIHLHGFRVIHTEIFGRRFSNLSELLARFTFSSHIDSVETLEAGCLLIVEYHPLWWPCSRFSLLSCERLCSFDKLLFNLRMLIAFEAHVYSFFLPLAELSIFLLIELWDVHFRLTDNLQHFTIINPSWQQK